jgi:hypothetical protein
VILFLFPISYLSFPAFSGFFSFSFFSISSLYALTTHAEFFDYGLSCISLVSKTKRIVFHNNHLIHLCDFPANLTPWQVSLPNCHCPPSQTSLLLPTEYCETHPLPYNPNHDRSNKKKKTLNYQNTIDIASPIEADQTSPEPPPAIDIHPSPITQLPLPPNTQPTTALQRLSHGLRCCHPNNPPHLRPHSPGPPLVGLLLC